MVSILKDILIVEKIYGVSSSYIPMVCALKRATFSAFEFGGPVLLSILFFVFEILIILRRVNHSLIKELTVYFRV
jgi:hypothetical protein